MTINFKDYIASVKDFPEPGIIFRDISPLMADGKAYAAATDEIAAYAQDKGVEMIVGPEARGFIVGCPVAYKLGIGFATLYLHKDAIKPGQRVLVCDDLLATGGTIAATIRLVEQLGGVVVGTAFLIELSDLHGRDKTKDYDMFTLMSYTGA